MSKNGHIQLRCELGSIALIVDSKFSINRGIIVRVIEPLGLMRWPGFEFNVIPVWRVEVLCKETTICYHLPQKGELRQESTGLVPDRFMRALTPLTGQQRFEFEDYEPESQLVATVL
ncbi:hypothetical protein G6677_07845 [Polynucleobacter paneuropaeus]|nr:hypothetical protein [Polynucleobacter paneuropaeus]